MIVVLLLLCANVKAVAQEVDLPTYINHMADNPFMISPSYAGIGAQLQFRLNGVSQWVGVKNAPNTQSLVAEARLADRFGGGITIFNDSNGFTKQQGGKLSFASHLILSDYHNSFLSFGLTYGYNQFSIDTEKNNTDEALPNISMGVSNFDISMLYRYENFAISANVINLLNKKVEIIETNEPQKLRKLNVYFVHTSRISHDMELEPSIFVEFFESDQRSKTDLNIKLRKSVRDGYIWAGLSGTFVNDQLGKPVGIAPLVGLKKNMLYVSYGVGITLNEIVRFNYGTHMITLGLDYNRRPSLARCTKSMKMF